jgi:hypothetical protein
MKRNCYLAAAALALLVATAWADAPSVTVEYAASPLGGGRWQYTYTVENPALGRPVEEFTIWFGYDAYRNLALATPDPPAAAWNEVVVQPDPVLHDSGFYDALTRTVGIPVGGSEGGFAVTFDWLGAGTPGAQAFDILDPVTFQPVYSGMTVPEPATLALLSVLGVLTLRRRR